jgi:hypothetical protein
MKSCESIREVMGAWLDGELTVFEAEVIKLHVESCSVCGKERRQLEYLHSTLSAALKTEGSKLAFEPFWHNLQERITRKSSWYEELGDWMRASFTAPRLVWAVPAVIVIVLAGLSIDSFLPNSNVAVPRDNFATVESIDSYGRNVALLREDETKTTVIWLYQNQESENESYTETTTETTESKPSF